MNTISITLITKAKAIEAPKTIRESFCNCLNVGQVVFSFNSPYTSRK